MSSLRPEDPRSIGDYQLLGRLGAGGMGRVYLGRSPGGRDVAVKVVHVELVRRPEFRSRFRREVEAARLVSGAFTAPVIDADPDAPLPWLVTSYIAGPSLEQAVVEQGPFGTDAVRRLAAGLAEALVSIHSVNLVHRDLKPSNVLLAQDGPRVIDFGIVRSVEGDSITGTGHMAGSPGFMAPEQVSGDEITPATDIFCLGAVLAFAATGGNPFGAGPTPALLYRVVHNEPDVTAVGDPALRALIAACLAKDPADRPTPRDILARIGPADAESTMALPRIPPGPDTAAGHTHVPGPARRTREADPPRPARPATQVEPTPAPAGRSRRAFLLSGAGAVAALGVGAGLWFNRPESAGPPESAPGPAQPVGVWPLDEASGALARDTAGDNDGTASGVRWRAGGEGAAEFDGNGSQIITEVPVLRTGAGRSFTVAAWVRLATEPGTFATVVSQEAGDASGFYLQYSSDEQRWAFARPGQRAVGYSVPAVNTWTHLVGVCDGAGRKLRLYVDGVQQAETRDIRPLPAPGGLMIGRATYEGRPSDFFPGAIRDVRVFDRALTSARIKALV
ncbi:LamG-like jellyroll fold domain-containing protein [Streptomyces sp. NPDC057002]|uniref:protein kinase domain-containing protein n=1 Tax=Streptomyces sp. NPDC057002 TaxID=3345992 RepID=UPI003637A03B